MFKKVLFILMALSLIVPFVYAGERVVTVGGNQPTRPITDFGINLTTAYYVDSVNGDDGRRGLSPETAVATLDYAISLTTINQGDIIYLMPNSDETISAAGGVTVDMAGVRIIGLGSGADRPTFTFSATTSTMLFTAASTSIENVLLVPSIDNVASAIVVSAADVSLDIEARDASATVEFIRIILTTAAADNLTIRAKIRGYIAGTAGVTPIQLVGVDTARIYVDYYGEASTAVVNFITTACLDIQITGLFWNDNVALTKNVIDTEGNGEWLVYGWDGKGGYFFTGSDAIALAAGGNTTVDAILVDTGTTIPATITTIDGFHDVATANAGTNVVMSDVIGNKTDTAVGTVTTDKSITGYLKGALEDTITISGATLPATPVTGSLATFVSGGSTALGQPLPASMSLVDIIGDFTGAYNGAAQDDNIKASLDLLNTDSAITVADTPYIADAAIAVPVADSLASFIVSGGVAAGQNLPTSMSLIDIIGNYTGAYNAIEADDNIKAQLDLMTAQMEQGVTGSTAVMVNGDTIFTIAGGPIEVMNLVSVCITSNDGTASTLQYSADPTVGGAITFSGATATLANFAAGGAAIINMTALATAPDLSVVAVGLGPVQANRVVINEGIITIVIGTDSTTGTWKHYLRYRPLGPGVTVTGT